jgi:sugar O-acyltransferase (sialic acid O-acetyltransferase NeuD family)
VTSSAGAPLLLAGAGGHARACIDVVESEGRFAIAGLVGLAGEVGTSVLGYRVLGDDDALAELALAHRRALVTVGQIKTPAPRIQLFERLTNLGCEMPAVISPRAYVSKHATIGPGTIVMHGAIVNAGATIGRNCIINSQALVEHDAVVGDHCHVATNAVLNGGVRLGRGSFVGSGTHTRNGITIGANCVIGMGQRILKDCLDDTCIPQQRRAES